MNEVYILTRHELISELRDCLSEVIPQAILYQKEFNNYLREKELME